MNSWEHYSHEADIGVRGRGPDMATAFANAAVALTAIVTDIENVAAVESIDISCEASDDELLFVDWLNEIIYIMATQKQLFRRFRVDIVDHNLTATLYGEEIDLQKHHPVVEPKGATYTTLEVSQTADGSWLAQTVVDV